MKRSRARATPYPRFSPAAPPVPSLEEELAARLARGEEVVLATVIKLDGEPPSRTGAKLLLSRDATLAGTLGCSEFDAAALDDARRVADAGAPQLHAYRHDLGSIEVYLEPHAPAPTLVVFGATPVARELVRWAPEVGFRPLLVETRRQRLAGWPPGAVTQLSGLDAALGADTPAEIALSILAGLVARRRGRDGGWLKNRG